MTTTAPTWLNLDAFEIPEAAVADLRRTIDELRALLPQMERLTTRAKTALAAIDEAPTDNLPDDVAEALWELTGETELRDVLHVIGWYAEEITDGCVTDEYREKIRAKRGI